jgi:uracil-DNA glycosylase
MIPLRDIVGDWDTFLGLILAEDDVVSSLNYINTLYVKHEQNLINPRIYPDQENVFKAFQECPYKKLSVVILLQDPYHDGRATGLALANPLDGKLSPSLKVVRDTVFEKVYKYHVDPFFFDPSLFHWARQGVLMLNIALTVEEGKPHSHSNLWSAFTHRVIRKLSDTNSGIIYCLWGKDAEFYGQYINKDSNTILKCVHPVYASYKCMKWDCDHFNEINDYLKKFNNFQITW